VYQIDSFSVNLSLATPGISGLMVGSACDGKRPDRWAGFRRSRRIIVSFIDK
jgi:hypothetical protein